jgi:hypothetical protein
VAQKTEVLVGVSANLHRNRRSHADEGIDHQADQGAVAQTGQGSGVDRVDQGSCLVGLQHRRLAAPLRVLRSTHGMGGIDGQNLRHLAIKATRLSIDSSRSGDLVLRSGIHA